MAQRVGKTERYQSGQASNAKGEPGEKVPVKFRMAAKRNAGNPDPLAQSLIAPPHVYADTVHFYHGGSSAPRGASYNPAGEFGKMRK